MIPENTRRSQAGSVSRLLVGFICMLVPFIVLAESAGPAWWKSRKVTNGNPENDYAAVNQGQLKNIASAAAAELNAVGLSGTFNGMVAQWQNSTRANDYAAVNLGQLKTVAKPFYDVLLSVGFHSHPLESGTYPWLRSSANPANDYAMANIGQVKNLFSFDLSSLTPVDNGLPDDWEFQYFGRTGIDPNGVDAANGGITYLQDYLEGRTPNKGFVSDVTSGSAGASCLNLELFTPLQ